MSLNQKNNNNLKNNNRKIQEPNFKNNFNDFFAQSFPNNIQSINMSLNQNQHINKFSKFPNANEFYK